MNQALVNRKFEIPPEILKKLKTALNRYGSKFTDGRVRCERLIAEKQLTYDQIKRMIHDMKYINKSENPEGYELNGGQEMFNWATKALNDARREVNGRKNSRARANEIGGLDGIRKNAFKQHGDNEAKDTINQIMFNGSSDRESITPMISEEIIKINSIMYNGMIKEQKFITEKEYEQAIAHLLPLMPELAQYMISRDLKYVPFMEKQKFQDEVTKKMINGDEKILEELSKLTHSQLLKHCIKIIKVFKNNKS